MRHIAAGYCPQHRSPVTAALLLLVAAAAHPRPAAAVTAAGCDGAPLSLLPVLLRVPDRHHRASACRLRSPRHCHLLQLLHHLHQQQQQQPRRVQTYQNRKLKYRQNRGMKNNTVDRYKCTSSSPCMSSKKPRPPRPPAAAAPSATAAAAAATTTCTLRSADPSHRALRLRMTCCHGV